METKDLMTKLTEIESLIQNLSDSNTSLKQVSPQLAQAKTLINEARASQTLACLQSHVSKICTQSVVITDTKGNIQWCNSAFTSIFGYSAEEAIGKTPKLLKSGQHNQAFYKKLWGTIKAGKVWHEEIINKTKSGQFINCEMIITPILNAQGIITHFICIEQNITQHKKIEQVLRESRDRIELLLNSTVEGIYAMDLEGKCTLCNSASIKLLGYNRIEELLNQDIHPLIHHTHKDGRPYPLEDCKIYQSFCKGEGTHHDDEIFWRADGTCFPVEYWSHPIIQEGKIIGSVVTFIDISERQQTELLRQSSTELKRFNQELEAQVQQRTEELQTTNEKLQATNEELLTTTNA